MEPFLLIFMNKIMNKNLNSLVNTFYKKASEEMAKDFFNNYEDFGLALEELKSGFELSIIESAESLEGDAKEKYLEACYEMWDAFAAGINSASLKIREAQLKAENIFNEASKAY